MSVNALATNEELHKGDYLVSNDGNYKAIFQDDGNFVVYGRSPVWASATDGKGATRLVMQDDGNLVIYGSDGKVLWSSKKNVQNCCLHLNTDGSLVVQSGITTVWSSK